MLRPFFAGDSRPVSPVRLGDVCPTECNWSRPEGRMGNPDRRPCRVLSEHRIEAGDDHSVLAEHTTGLLRARLVSPFRSTLGVRTSAAPFLMDISESVPARIQIVLV